MEHYFGENAIEKLDGNIPVLILGNKVDLVKSFTEKNIEKLLHPTDYSIKFKIGCVSALKNMGLEDNFKWLVKELLI